MSRLRQGRRARTRRARMSAALAAALLAVTVLAPAARANTPGSGLGVNGWYLFWEMPQSQWNLQVTEMAADGIQVARADAFWSSVEPNAPGANGPQYNWTTTDAIATVLAEHGVRWLPIIDYSAPWAESVAGNIKSPPNNDAAYAAYAAAVVARYGPGGTFWAENPSLTPEPVTGVEIWNEPNVADSAIPAPQYAVLYEDARTAIHAVDPSVQAIVGGLVNPANQYLEQMYAALGGPGKIDAVGQHPYDVSVAATVADMKRLRIAMDNEGDANVPIDITEFGWPTSGSASWSTTLTDATRAVDLTQAIDELGKSDCGIERILPYSWVTAQSNSADVGDFFGLVSPDGSPTLSSAAMAAEYKLLEASNSGSAGNDACGRPLTLKLTSVASTSPTTNSCVTASVLTWSAAGSATVGVAGAKVSFTSPAATTATTGSNGQATVCWSLPVGHTASVSATASQQYFYPQPQASLSILPGTTATVATVKPKPEVKPNTKPKPKATPKPKAKKKATKKPKKRKRKPATKCVAGKQKHKHQHKHKTCRTKRQQRRGAKRK